MYANSALYPTRNGYNHSLFTWNRKVFIGAFTVLNTWRVLTTTNLEKIKIADKWDANSDITDIFTNLVVEDCKKISVGSGDLYEEYIDASENEGRYVFYAIVYTYVGAEAPCYVTYNYSEQAISNYSSYSAPSLTYNGDARTFTIGTSIPGRRYIEFHRTDVGYGYPSSISDENTLNEFLLTTVLNEEAHDPFDKYLRYWDMDDYRLNRWAKGTYTVGVDFQDGTNEDTINKAINQALSQINGVLEGDYGVKFKRSKTATSGDITIIVDTEKKLYDIDLETTKWGYGGTWQTTIENGYITGAVVKIASDILDYVPYTTYQTIALEELLQSMGAGYDQTDIFENTIHVEFNYLNKPSELTTNDANILKLLYSKYVTVGDDATAISKALNIPKGIKQLSASYSDTALTVSADFLEPNAKYEVRAFIVNEGGPVSLTSAWLGITTANKRPCNWEWITPKSADTYIPFSDNAFHPVTATEWNRFLDRIDAFRTYKGLAKHGIAAVSTGDDFTLEKYNQAVTAIAECGVSLSAITSDEAYISYGLFNRLSTALNSIA